MQRKQSAWNSAHGLELDISDNHYAIVHCLAHRHVGFNRHCSHRREHTPVLGLPLPLGAITRRETIKRKSHDGSRKNSHPTLIRFS